MYKELKKNKYTVIVFCIFLGLFIIGWVAFGLVMPKDNDEKYGNRLDDLKEEYGSQGEVKKATDEQREKYEKDISKKSYVKSVSTNVEGKIINIIVTVKSGTKTKKAKDLGSTVLNGTDKTIKKYYDLQLFIKNEKDKAKGYPIIGYKNSTDKSFVF